MSLNLAGQSLSTLFHCLTQPGWMLLDVSLIGGCATVLGAGIGHGRSGFANR